MMGQQGERIQGFCCPKCGGDIVYNGNYFCDRIGDDCDWALSDTRIAWANFGRRLYAQLMKQRNEETTFHNSTPLTPDWPEHDGHRCWARPHPDSPVREVWEAAEARTLEGVLQALRLDAESWEQVAEQNAADGFDEPDPERDALRIKAVFKAQAVRAVAIMVEDTLDPSDGTSCGGHLAGVDTPHYSAEGDWRPDDDDPAG